MKLEEEKGNLPKVRTSSAKYRNEFRPRIETLSASSYFKLSNDIYGRMTVGFQRICMPVFHQKYYFQPQVLFQ